MMGLILAGALVTGPYGNSYIQPMDGGYNIINNQGITQVKDYGGYTQIRQPGIGTTNIIDMGGEQVIPVVPVVPVAPAGGYERAPVLDVLENYP